jgi:hypothetical protein
MGLIARGKNLFRRDRLDAEIEEELQANLAMRQTITGPPGYG